MAQPNRACPECGTSLPSDAPGGLCPRCLLGAGLTATADHRPPGRGPSGPVPPPPSYDGFRAALLDLGLVDPADLDGLAADAGGDAANLARALVRAGKLTPYQAGAVVQGKARGLVIGRYLVLDRLGVGGMGVVFKARHRQTRQVVALKILPPSFSREAEAVRRFRREFQVAAHLKHPNLVAAIEADADRGVHFLTMEYVAGRDLETLVREDGPLSVKLALHCAIQIARGLEAAHAQGVIHRDVKPGNVMIDAAGNVRVCDLGLARILEATSHLGREAGPSLTQTGAYMGSVDFLAPEQANDAKKADHRADIYSLGCTLYYLLAGRPPFGGDTILKRLIAHQERPAPSLRDARPEVPAALDAVYLKTMAKRPGDRPVSMSLVIAALEACRASPREAGDASADLKTFATTFMKRAAPKRRGLDASVFARPQERSGLQFDPDLNLEDLVNDYRPEGGREDLPEEKLPPPLPRKKQGWKRSRDRRLAPTWMPGTLLGLGVLAAFAVYGLRPGPARPPLEDPGLVRLRDPAPSAASVSARATRPASFRLLRGQDGDYPSLVANWAATPPVLDGDITPGEYATVVPVDFRKGSAFGRMLQGLSDPATEKEPDDLSLDLHAAYDARALYVGCRVRDQFIDVDESDAAQPFLNDGVSLFLDGDQATNDFVFDNPGPRGSREGFQIVADATGRQLTIAGDLANNDWKAAAKRTPGGYVVEFEIPLAAIDTIDGDGERPPGPGALIRLGLAVEDQDAPKNARRAFGFLQAREGVKSPFLGQESAWKMGLFLEPRDLTAGGSIASAGFVPLFDGKDLAGWKTHPSQPGSWKVADGLLVAEGAGPSHLYTERDDYADFRLRWEVRINEGGNSGVHLRAPFGPSFPAATPRYPEGYEASVNYGPRDPAEAPQSRYGPSLTGTIYAGSGGSVVNVSQRRGGPGEWVRMEAVARGDRVTVSVNGEVLADYTDPERRWTRGHIALQCHDPETSVAFRNIEIEELAPETPTTAASETSSALSTADVRGAVILDEPFDDNRNGWRVEDTPVEGGDRPFRKFVQGGVYHLEVPPAWKGFEAWDATDPIDRPFEVEAVARTTGPADAYGAFAVILAGPEGRGFQVSINPGGKLAVYDSPWDAAGGKKYFEPHTHLAMKAGAQWNTLTLRVHSRSLEVLVNGQAVCPPIATDHDLLPSKPEVAVIKGDDSELGAEFDRLVIRELKADSAPAGAPVRVIYTDDFEEVRSGWARGRHQSDDGPTNNRSDYDGAGHYAVQAEADWAGTSMCEPMAGNIAGDHEVEVVGRVVGQGPSPGGWGIMVGRGDSRGIHVLIDRNAQLRVVPSFWGVSKFPNDRSFGPIRHAAIRPADQWNTLTLRVHNRSVEILVNGTAVCEPFALDWDLLPAAAAFALTKPDFGTRVRTEFDRVQVRRLPPP